MCLDVLYVNFCFSTRWFKYDRDNLCVNKNIKTSWSYLNHLVHNLIYLNMFIFSIGMCRMDDSLLFSAASSIPLCYVLFPATLLHQLFFHPPVLHLAIYFLVYLTILLFPNSLYNTPFENSIFFHSLYMPKPT
jgi:hypothetical protein